MAKQKEFTSSKGNKFTLQKVAPAQWLDILDDAEGDGGKMKRSKMYGAVLENIVVQPPQMKINDFDADGYDGYAELDEVVTAAIRFQQGK